MNKRDISIVLAITVLAIAAIAIFSYVVVRAPSPAAGPAASSTASAPSSSASAPALSISTSGWKTYTSSVFKFSFAYPPSWRNSGDPLTVVNPHIFFGNPLSGTTTYRLSVFAYYNPQNLSAADYVSAMIASTTAADIRSGAASGTAPRLTPRFSREFAFTTARGIPAYELYDVFEFDHQSEQVYVQDGSYVILFDFPTADANPNLADPAANNAVAHAIVDSLTLQK